jgi:hypothetical protein
MDESTILAALQAGPPDEDGRSPDGVSLAPAPVTARVSMAYAGIDGASGSRWGLPLLALAAVAIVVVALAAFGGARLARLSTSAGAAGGGRTDENFVPPIVAPALSQAYGDLVRPRSWMVCAVDNVVACQPLTPTTPSTALIWQQPIVDPGRPVAVRGQHIAVGAWFDPARLPSAYLIPLNGTSANWQPLVVVHMGGGGLLLDLPSVAPGHYLVVLGSDALGAGGVYEVAGIEVASP